MFDNVFLWAQVVGLFAMIFSIVSWQLKNPRHIILMNVPGCSLWAIQYIMLGGITGALMNIFSVFKDGALGFVRCSIVPYIISAYLLLIWAFGIYFFNNWFDSLALAGGTISNLALLKRDNRALMSRACIASQICWITYNSIVGAWIALICGVLVTVSSLIGMYRHENWEIGKCYKSFLPSVARFLFVFPNLKLFP